MGPLEGVRVVDLSTVLSGPVATAILADQGADVVRVEAPDRVDITRVVGSHRNGVTAMFHLVNRGKRSIVVDLSTSTGKAVLHRLVATADVVVQNFRTGVADRMGIGYEELRASRADLIYVSIAGFGFDGPLAGLRVYDNMIQAASGVAYTQGTDDEPRYIRNLACDKITALNAAQAITAALFARDRGRGGQHVRLSMLDAAVSFLWYDAATPVALLADDATRVPTNRSYGLTRHLDGWTTSVPVSDDEFRGWCRAFDSPEVADDPRYATTRDRLTDESFDAVRAEVQSRAARLTVAEALARLDAEGVAAVEAVPLERLPDRPQLVANATFRVQDHPDLGPVREVEPVARFEATPAASGGPAPAAGADTDVVLHELGYTSTEITALREGRVVA